MDQKYRRMLPANICELVDATEAEMGHEIIVDDQYVFKPEVCDRQTGKVFVSAACICDVTPEGGISAVLPVTDSPSPPA